MEPRDEAAAILRLTDNRMADALHLLESQIQMLAQRSQVLMTLAGVVVTVTGFSGRLIAGTSPTAQLLIVAGVFVVVFSAMWQFRNVMQFRWLTQLLDREPLAAVTEMVERRNRKAAAYRQGGIVFFLGACLYLAALSLMLLYPDGIPLAPR